MNLLIKLLLNAIIIFVIAELLNGVVVSSYGTALIVAVVLSVLNLIVKPILVILTLPITVFTLGLFLLVINAIIILIADNLIQGFSVNSIWTAILFSILVSIFQSILYSFTKDKGQN